MTCFKHFQKSSLVAINTAEQPIDVGGFVNFGTNRLLTGVSIQHAEGSSVARLLSAGLYLVTFDADYIITTTGEAIFQLQNKGEDVLGAETTVQATATEPIGIHFSTIINILPSCIAIDNSAALQVSTNAEGTISKSSLSIVKLA